MPFFRRPKADVVVVAVRYRDSHQIDWVRAYERRGPTWSDRINIRREELVERIRSGEKVVAGQRIRYEAGTFNYGEPLRLEDHNGQSTVISGTPNGSGDSLAEVPIV